jgi:hypothetical protein
MPGRIDRTDNDKRQLGVKIPVLLCQMIPDDPAPDRIHLCGDASAALDK